MTEKMAMRGEPITLSNVVNQVKAEFTDEKNEARITAMKRAVNDTSQKIFTNPPHTIEHGIVRTLERLSRGMITIVKRFFSFLRNL